MNGNSDGMERTTGDFVLFGMMFFGGVIAAAGVVGVTVPLAITGAAVVGFGVLGLLLKQFLGE